MSIITMQADSTSLILNGFAITDFAAGDVVELNPVNDLTSHVNSSDGGVNINKRVDAEVHDLVVRVQKFSPSDAFLNSQRNQPAPVVFNGSVKEDFVRDGTETSETYQLESGTITTQPANVKSDTDGNAMMEYTLRFRRAVRSL